jgi:hypothetical protein
LNIVWSPKHCSKYSIHYKISTPTYGFWSVGLTFRHLWKCAWVPKHFFNVRFFSCLNFVHEPKVKVVISFMGGSIPCGSIQLSSFWEGTLLLFPCCCSQVLLHIHNKNCVHFLTLNFYLILYLRINCPWNVPN